MSPCFCMLSNALLWRRVVARTAFSSSFLYTLKATSRHVSRLRFPSSSSITSMYRQRRHSCSFRSSNERTAFWMASISAKLASSIYTRTHKKIGQANKTACPKIFRPVRKTGHLFDTNFTPILRIKRDKIGQNRILKYDDFVVLRNM